MKNHAVPIREKEEEPFHIVAAWGGKIGLTGIEGGRC
jgi:hypothetical protein